MKRIHYLLLGLLVSLTIAAVSPTMPPTRIAAGSGVTVTTNGVNNFTLSASGGVGTSNGYATNLTIYSSTKVVAADSSAATYAARTQLFGFFRSDVPTTYGHRIQGSWSAATAESTLSFDAASGSASWVTPLVINGAGTVFIGGTNAGLSPSLSIGSSGSMGITGNFGAGDTAPGDRLVVSGGRAKILSGVAGDGSSWANRAKALSFYRTNIATTYENKISFSASGVAGDSTISLEVASGASTTTNALTANGLGDVAIGSGAPVARFTVVGGPIAMTAISAPSPISGNGLIYSKTSGTTEVWVMDSGGTETQISPHSANAPRWFYDREPGLEHVVESRQHFLGVVTFLNVERAAVLAAMTDAEKLAMDPKARMVRHVESFEDYNRRLNLADKKTLCKLDWNEVRAAKRSRELMLWQSNTNANRGPAPSELVDQKPAFIP